METSIVKSQAYGKDRVRVVRVIRHSSGLQEIVDYSVLCLLSGSAFAPSYTKGDNRLVIATDSQKNTVYYLAKTLPAATLLVPELFAMEVATFMVQKYKHVTECRVKVTTRPWERMQFEGAAHRHSFVREGKEVRWAEAVNNESNGCRVVGGFLDLEVLKTTNSSFTGFWRDELTTLPEMADRMLSTKVQCQWQFTLRDTAQLRRLPYDSIYQGAKHHTLDVFANDERSWVHASVQSTLYVMADRILRQFGVVDDVYYALPNIHYFPVDLGKLGLRNLAEDAEVYMPLADPSGLITATVSRPPVERKARL
ncbi:uricase [Kickxella alabastrina]|uniref:uricase n=1 Tax=Kickxella alabastrina TaxID=61397 RepID=UPI0022204E37|nr:uricase [Kickxella alabastrina]KAI7823997.1 uricase [Kickxella alabastrina]KAJ1931485.1 hypothetical protein GGF37_007380 [Kickxella alabastrina]